MIDHRPLVSKIKDNTVACTKVPTDFFSLVKSSFQEGAWQSDNKIMSQEERPDWVKTHLPEEQSIA